MTGRCRSWGAVALLVCLAAAWSVGTGAAQAPGPMHWAVYEFGGEESGADIIEIEGGGYAVAGTTQNESSDGMLLLRTDANGSVLWYRIYTLPGAAAHAVGQTPDSGYVLAGEEDGHPALIGTGPEGEVLWTGPEGINVTEYGPVRDLLLTADGGYLLAGSALPPGGKETAALVKTNESGHVEWTQTYERLNESRATALAPAGDDGYAVAGLSSGTEEVFLMMTGPDGNLTWTQTFPAAEVWPIFNDTRALMTAPDLARRAGGGYAVGGGVTFPERPVSAAMLLLTDENGTFERDWISQKDGDFWADSLARAGDDGFVLACHLDPLANPTNPVVLISTDKNGTSQWEVDVTPGFLNPFENDPRGIIATTEGGYAVTGETRTIDPDTGRESLDVFVLLIGRERTG